MRPPARRGSASSCDGEGEWDVLAGAGGVRVVAADRRPDSRRDLERRRARPGHDIAADLRGGMEAYQDRAPGRCRHNLHLGVGFLAATSGD